jgi:hypothetical protein
MNVLSDEERNLLRYYAETGRIIHGPGTLHQHLLRIALAEDNVARVEAAKETYGFRMEWSRSPLGRPALFGLNARLQDDWCPTRDFSLLPCHQCLRSLILRRPYVLSDFLKRSCTIGSAKEARLAKLTLAVTFCVGVPLGAHMPCQKLTSIFLISSSSRVGTSGAPPKAGAIWRRLHQAHTSNRTLAFEQIMEDRYDYAVCRRAGSRRLPS